MKTLFRLLAALTVTAIPASLAFSQSESFWGKFQPSYERGDMDGMKKAILRDTPNAIIEFFSRAERFATEGEEEVGKQVDALREAWKEVYNNQFFENQYKYLSYLDPEGRRQRKKYLETFYKMQTLFNETRGTSKEENWDGLQQQFTGLLEVLEGVGDLHYAAWSAYYLAACYDPSYRPRANNARLALDYYKKFLEFRERIDLKDGDFNNVRATVERMEKVYKPKADGEAPAADGSDGGTVPFKEGSSWTAVPMASAYAEITGEPERYAYDADELYMSWQKVVIETGKPATFPGYEGKTALVRDASTKYHLDADGDGKRNIKFKAIGKLEKVEFARPTIAANDKYAFWLVTGSQTEMVQKVQTNAAPTEQYATFYYRSAAARTAEFQGVPIKMYDENADGKFDAQIVERPWEGSAFPLPIVDSWALGKEKRVVPASSYAKFGEKWYRVEWDPKNTGLEMKFREVEENPATLIMEYKGPPTLKPDFLLVKAVGIYAGAIFDIAAHPKGVQVPAGAYEIFYGIVRMGKGKTAQKLAILRGSAKAVGVESGQTATIKVGEPFSLDFSTKIEASKLKLPGESVAVVGSSGERYVLIWDEVPTPEVQLRSGGKSVGKSIEMKRAAQADLNKEGAGWSILWHPLDVEMELPKGVESVEVKLSQKHKWFGKLESPWK